MCSNNATRNHHDRRGSSQAFMSGPFKCCSSAVGEERDEVLKAEPRNDEAKAKGKASPGTKAKSKAKSKAKAMDKNKDKAKSKAKNKNKDKGITAVGLVRGGRRKGKTKATADRSSLSDSGRQARGGEVQRLTLTSRFYLGPSLYLSSLPLAVDLPREASDSASTTPSSLASDSSSGPWRGAVLVCLCMCVAYRCLIALVNARRRLDFVDQTHRPDRSRRCPRLTPRSRRRCRPTLSRHRCLRHRRRRRPTRVPAARP